MGLLSTNLKARLQDPQCSLAVLLELTISETTYYYSDTAFAALGAFYAPKVLQWGSVRQSVRDRSNRLESVSTDVVIDDTDRSLEALFETLDISGSTAVVKLAEKTLASADWYTAFSGVIDTFDRVGGSMAWVLRLRSDDLALQRDLLRAPISQGDWPNADPEAYSLYAPLLYGRHESSTFGGGGMVPCILVDTINNRYLICLGWAKTVVRVYVAGVATTSYTVTNPIVNGRQYTCVTFAASQGASAVTVDVHGYEDTGDGTGALIETPAEVIRHLLSNFSFKTYTSGIWSAPITQIDSTSFITVGDFLAKFSHKASRRIAAQRTGQSELDAFCQSFNVFAYWTNTGKIGLAVEDHTVTAIYVSAPWMQAPIHMLQDAGIAYESKALLDRVLMPFAHSDATDKFMGTLSVRDPLLSRQAPTTLELPYSAAYR